MKWLLVFLIPFSVFAKQRIAIVDVALKKGYFDSSYLCKDGHYGNFMKKNPAHPHGTNIYNLVTKDLDKSKYCIVMVAIKYGDQYDIDDYYEGLRSIKNVSFVNMSLAGIGFFAEEMTLLEKMLDKGIFLFVASGNDSVNLDKDKRYPASYDFPHRNFVVIGNTAEHSNYGSMVDFVIDGNDKGLYFSLSGSSQSTAIALNIVLRSKKK